ncbi:MAG: DNA topoisomerase IB [Ktedonobacteraceae bacterium]
MSAVQNTLHNHSVQTEVPGDEVIEPAEVAKCAGLRYVSDMSPGIKRKPAGKHFSYIGLDGKPIHDQEELKRIRSIGIPPAWTNVWICPIPNGHIQATGRDAKGRKQYRYHRRWREVRDETKYSRMIAFGEALPAIRSRVAHDLDLPGLPHEKVLATVVWLLDTTALRVGNEEYARENGSFGLTTLRSRHVDISGSKIRFHFRGKSGKEHNVSVQNRQLARIIKRCQDLPGHELFQYVDDNGQRYTIASDDVNDYLHKIAGGNFTAKDFRTWSGTVFAVNELQALGEFETQTQAKKNVARAIDETAKHLGNTATICRKCYVYPEVIDAYVHGTLLTTLEQQQEASNVPHEGLRQDEVKVLTFLKECLKEEVK